MNVYNCWYEGSKGYCCRSYNNNWMFVPDLGQPVSVISRNLELEDLVFANQHEKQYEQDWERSRKNQGWIASLLAKTRPQSMAGFLFTN